MIETVELYTALEPGEGTVHAGLPPCRAFRVNLAPETPQAPMLLRAVLTGARGDRRTSILVLDSSWHDVGEDGTGPWHIESVNGSLDLTVTITDDPHSIIAPVLALPVPLKVNGEGTAGQLLVTPARTTVLTGGSVYPNPGGGSGFQLASYRDGPVHVMVIVQNDDVVPRDITVTESWINDYTTGYMNPCTFPCTFAAVPAGAKRRILFGPGGYGDASLDAWRAARPEALRVEFIGPGRFVYFAW